ncbi:hypothetical protein SynBIOSU31_00741 [Synechococcus sp. BIOS-U3-1]|uniref:hypothetical protein n=1 Tax=Synechococcus sp. BIOS-U3-1 TaxID=1400865 RepID=UPI001646D3ED|nr:hypothetical protein [Synechococcus sp. BIOS-U3-1]QNI57633.1 hypothetical protein SynBIOSU31_00741 [Synechococcus sp. BIOS-U3-1]
MGFTDFNHLPATPSTWTERKQQAKARPETARIEVKPKKPQDQKLSPLPETFEIAEKRYSTSPKMLINLKKDLVYLRKHKNRTIQS